MSAKAKARMLQALLPVLAMAFILTPSLSQQQPPGRASSVPDLFNREAAASDPAGIQKYSKDLIGLIVPDQAGGNPINPLVERLARAERMARQGKGRLVPEENVVRAFNELMTEAGAPSSLRADEVSMRRFREHAAAIKAFPALLSAGRNGMNCNPGEAVFLIYLLISNDGKLTEGFLDSAVARTHLKDQRSETGHSFAVAHMDSLGSSASGVLSSFSSNRNRNAVMKLFNNLADKLGF